ncbi:helix-turn-helix domain-containing protein [Lysinibacillus sp. 54212]|uniref:helix-turn-helix domain-containing protein n=1 Tax=Lysinibacillus sp. 54212 TaxID=3119829 RepID=UPI002FC81640
MLFQQILLHIFLKLNNERTVSAAYHLIKGKRSGQTIQDVGIFKLHPYFGLLRKLDRKRFDEEVALLVQYNYLKVTENGYYEMKATGLKKANTPMSITFDGWHYQGNEHVFFARLSLIVQSLSYQKASIRSFIPIQRNDKIQQWCRGFLLTNEYQSNSIQKLLHDEMEQSLIESDTTEQQKQFIVSRLVGANMPGVTWQQLAYETGQTELDCQFLYIAALHQWLQAIYKKKAAFPLLFQMMEGVRIDAPLTDSANQTALLYRQGYSPEQIGSMRRLKLSTIEDHLVEIAMNEPDFDISPFISQPDCLHVHQAVEAYATRKLKVLREVLPNLSYFQIRLALAKGDS